MSLMLTDFTLDIRDTALRRRSTRSEPWQLVYDRDLTADDLVLLSAALTHVPDDLKAPLARIGEPHHALARAVAQGKGNVEISALYGYSPSRIATLRDDPTFQELVLHYEEQFESARADIDSQVQHLALKAKQILLDRMDEEPDSFSNKDLKDMMTAGLDRIGHGPSSTHRVDINNPARALEAMTAELDRQAKGRVLSRAEAATLEAEYTEVPTDDETPARDGPDES